MSRSPLIQTYTKLINLFRRRFFLRINHCKTRFFIHNYITILKLKNQLYTVSLSINSHVTSRGSVVRTVTGNGLIFKIRVVERKKKKLHIL